MSVNHDALTYQLDGHNVEYNRHQTVSGHTFYQVHDVELPSKLCREIAVCGCKLYCDPHTDANVLIVPNDCTIN